MPTKSAKTSRKRGKTSLQTTGFRSRRALLAFVLVFAAFGASYLLVTYAATDATATTTKALPFGLFESTNNLQYSFPAKPTYAIQYYGWQEGFQTTDADAAWAKGTQTFAELQTCGNPCDTTGVPISGVTNGTYDAYLTAFANEVKAFGHPVLLTFDHEMNGSWYPWGDTKITSTQWKAAWDHVTSHISAIAKNVTWVWAPNIEQGAVKVAPYWPGTAGHVGLVGLDGYFQNTGSTWANTFTTSYKDVLAASGSKYHFVVAETGVPATDSNNLTQINNLVAGARSVKASGLMYFDSGTKWSLSKAEQTRFVAQVK